MDVPRLEPAPVPGRRIVQVVTPESARLRFRRPTAADADAIFARYASDPDVTRFLGWPRHQSIDDTRAFLAFGDGEWTQRPAGPLLIETRHDGRLIGSTGLMFDGAASAMVGYVLARDAWGQGYATEALGAMVALADSLGVVHLHSACHPQHRASAHVLEKGGFHLNACFMAARFPNLDGDRGDALRYLRPPTLKIEHLHGQRDIDACAEIMATSEPWITLQRTVETLRPVLGDPAKEVHLVRDAQGIAAFVILDMRGALGGYVQTIAVRADRRSSGLGAAILSAVEERVYRQSPNVFLCVSVFNTRAQRFYARMGYERIGVWREYVVAGSDEILMRKTIGPLRTHTKQP
jgi:RimJ/RimL family protein N-acetyltransferase